MFKNLFSKNRHNHAVKNSQRRKLGFLSLGWADSPQALDLQYKDKCDQERLDDGRLVTWYRKENENEIDSFYVSSISYGFIGESLEVVALIASINEIGTADTFLRGILGSPTEYAPGPGMLMLPVWHLDDGSVVSKYLTSDADAICVTFLSKIYLSKE